MRALNTAATGMQAQGGWLVVPFTDNIFAIVAEELGFVGAMAFLALLVFILMRIFRAARSAQDYAGGLIVAGVGTYLTAQIFVNIGVVLQIFPVTGISLPGPSSGPMPSQCRPSITSAMDPSTKRF